MRLYISSGTHSFTDPEDRIAEIESELGIPEVVFTETPTQRAGLTDIVLHSLTAPLLLSTLVFWAKILLPGLQAVFGDDAEVEMHFVSKGPAKEIPTDVPRMVLLENEVKLYSMANWTMIIGIAFLFLIGNSMVTVFTLLFSAGVALFLSFLAGVNETRNAHIAMTVASHADTYETACLVVGADHHEQVGELLQSYEDITVLNPMRE